MLDLTVLLGIILFLFSLFFIIFGISVIFQYSDKMRERRAQPVVQATTTVYTLPSSDPRYPPGTNVSTSLRHVYDLPPSYDQVVIQSTVQTPPPPPPTHTPPPFTQSSIVPPPAPSEVENPTQVVVAK